MHYRLVSNQFLSATRCSPAAAKKNCIPYLAVALICFLPTQLYAQTATSSSPADAMMLEINGVTPNSPELFKAIRAQLSASKLVIHQIHSPLSPADIEDPLPVASDLTARHGTEMVFWIEDQSDTCTVTFYSIKDPERVYRRVLHLGSNNPSSRFEVIANAVSSLLEETIFTFREKPTPPPSQKKEEPPPPAPSAEPKGIRSELFATYTGVLLAQSKICHGVQMGLGFLPTDHLTLDISYTQNLTLEWESPQYRFSVTSRNIDIAVGSRLKRKAVELRLGVAYSVNIRSLSTQALSESISPRSDQLDGVHSLVPFFAAALSLSEHFSLLTHVGGAIALNERDYKIARDDGTQVTVTAPYTIKFVYQIGFLIQL